jgi:hypothetical protein
MTNTREEGQKNIFTALQEKYEELGDDLIDTVFFENQRTLKKRVVRSREFKKMAFLLLLKHGGSYAGDLLPILEDDLYMDDDITASDVLDRERLASLCKTLIEEDKEIWMG